MMSNDIIEGVDDAVGGVRPWVSFLLLHLVFWGEDEGEELDDGDDVQGKLTIPDQVSAELDAVHVVRLTIVVEAHLLQLSLATGDVVLPNLLISALKKKFSMINKEGINGKEAYQLSWSIGSAWAGVAGGIGASLPADAAVVLNH